MSLKPLLILLHLLHQIFYLLSLILRRIGLTSIFHTAPTDNQEVLFSADPSPAILTAAESIKSQLPIVDYISFANGKLTGESWEPPPACAVCLQFMEARDQVRELGNCRHAFHVSCIDRWLDLGRFSCPLCRSALLPPPAGRRRGPVFFLKLLIAGQASSFHRSC
ncbi:E3 ubiquitin-protein ligase RHA1B-like [Phalaenopsis equestris]|uniref:RING-type domain-containing protein n=1 Tax=Phalaenopsis equestris TaxID=78828 RepID=A0A1S6YG33_PHAEQ|nr:E3 ubiquitin-protein ligase RHA1B-like [Phalaenopsis equestris]AQX44227.1 hypothetical protein [Phalaenopsis equestris]